VDKTKSSDMNITVCIPTFNEKESISKVISDIRECGYEPVVIDGGSTDGTVEIVENKNVELINQQYTGGKGAAIKESIDKIDTDILVLIDGDCTYEPTHIQNLVKPILKDDYDHVIGNRFHNMDPDAMSGLHKFGNKIINLIFRILFGKNLVDILTGFRALKTDSFNTKDIDSQGFDIETELSGYSIKNDHKIKIIGTNYYKRKGESKLGTIKDSIKIASRMLTTRLKRE
jgi:glycosyltransferase involved in cell wall biosynthesis